MREVWLRRTGVNSTKWYLRFNGWLKFDATRWCHKIFDAQYTSHCTIITTVILPSSLRKYSVNRTRVKSRCDVYTGRSVNASARSKYFICTRRDKRTPRTIVVGHCWGLVVSKQRPCMNVPFDTHVTGYRRETVEDRKPKAFVLE